jgi:hypothetical protein
VFVTGLPDAPRAVAADQRGRTLSVSWLRPLDDQGIPIARYDVQVTGQGGSAKKTCSLFAPKVPKDADPWAHRFSCSVGGLKVGATYTVSVLAANSISEVTSPSISVRMRAGAPSAPRDVSFLPGDDVIAVGALLPASRGGAKTISLKFRAWTKASGGKVSAQCAAQLQQDDSIGLCELTGLLNYEPYWIDASAKSARGSSATIARVKVEPSPQVPTAPRDFRLRVKDSDVVASWEAPIFDGGFPIRRYIVRVTNKEMNGEIVKTCITQAPELTCDITGLETDKHLWFTVVAENTVGESQPSDQIDRTT